jgi:hypothetical protein
MEPIEPNFHQYEIKEFFNLIVSTSFNYSSILVFLNLTNRLISRMLAFLHFGSAIGTEYFSKVYPLFHQVLPRNLDLGGLYLKNQQKNYFSY